MYSLRFLKIFSRNKKTTYSTYIKTKIESKVKNNRLVLLSTEK